MSQYLTGKFDMKENNDNDRKKMTKNPIGLKINRRQGEGLKEREKLEYSKGRY